MKWKLGSYRGYTGIVCSGLIIRIGLVFGLQNIVKALHQLPYTGVSS